MEELKEIPENYIGKGEVEGFKFSQLEKGDAGYVYQVELPCGRIHFEVFKRIVNTQYNCISKPRSKSFGDWAWCINDKEEAYLKYAEICNRYHQKLQTSTE